MKKLYKRTVLMASCLTVVLCLFLFPSGTWAWFTDGSQSAAGQIQSAVFSLDVTVVEFDGTEHPVSGGSAALAAGTYGILLTPTGTASSGYCRIFGADEVYVTGRIIEPYLVVITLFEDAALKFVPCWGTYTGAETVLPNDIQGFRPVAPEDVTTETVTPEMEEVDDLDDPMLEEEIPAE